MDNIKDIKLLIDLTTLGYWSGGVKALNSVEKERLKTSVRMYQHDYGLVVDGIAGDKTRAKLLETVANRLQTLVIHCSATRAGLDVKAETVVKYHMSKSGRGWSRPGYSDIIELDGSVRNVWKYDDDGDVETWEFTNGVLGGLNRNARHACYIGGLDVEGETCDTRTEEQRAALTDYVRKTIKAHQNIVVVGHNYIQRKGCPSFDVAEWMREIGANERNIAKFRLY